MTTDTKAVTRWDWDYEGTFAKWDGDYVLFTDHERIVEEIGLLWARELVKRDDALAASRAEVEENEKVINVWRGRTQRAEAEVEGLKKDAERWRYTRRKLCLTGNGNGTCGMQAINLPESIPGWPEPGGVGEFCDSAIDAEMEKRA